MTKLEFKLGTAQYLSRIFHYEQMNMCSSVRQGNISALIGKEEERGGERLFFFLWKYHHWDPLFQEASVLKSLGGKGSHPPSLWVSAWNGETRIHSWYKHEGIRQSLLSRDLSSGSAPAWFPNAAMHWNKNCLSCKCAPSLPEGRTVEPWQKSSHQPCEDACSTCR